ncbi:MAG: hypothetical protein JW940_06515 [Polyangiaceae bacterium]|nr:hypothetical protein [Polyangiaceae bacterium]
MLAPGAHAYCIANTCQLSSSKTPCTEDAITRCPVGGKPFFFVQHCLSYSVNVRGSGLLGLDYEGTVSLVSEAMSKWDDAQCTSGPCSARGFLFPAVTCDEIENNTSGPNANIWVFVDDWEGLDPEALAITTTHINPYTGEVYGSDVSVQSGALVVFSRERVVTILAHESGHVFGLGHSNNAISLMVEREGPGLAHDPTPDDLAGLCALHPPQPDDSACDPTPRHGFSPLCGEPVENCTCSTRGSKATPSVAAAALLLMVTWVRSRRRGRSVF